MIKKKVVQRARNVTHQECKEITKHHKCKPRACVSQDKTKNLLINEDHCQYCAVCPGDDGYRVFQGRKSGGLSKMESKNNFETIQDAYMVDINTKTGNNLL
jgi:hypothetical protein